MPKKVPSSAIILAPYNSNHLIDEMDSEDPEYIKKYPIIKDLQAHRILDLKIQKIEKTQGYHKWHTEMMNSGTRNRFATFILYLNTV